MTPTIELLEHNREFYKTIKEQIDSGKVSIFYSEATGLGKSYIFMRIVCDYFVGKRIMYVVPKIAIWENITHYNEFSNLPALIEMKTFTAFNTYNSEDRLYDKYDAVFVDECHHMLSDIQGTNVGRFLHDMNINGKYAFGMTATPKYGDKYIDEEYFDVSCYGYDVFEAIRLGLFPKVDIAVANIDVRDISSDLQIKFSVSRTKSILEQIIEERSDITHWLAYFGRKKDLEDNEKEIVRLFPEFTILKLYHNVGDPREIIEYFESYNGKVILMSVSMLLEGMHLDNVGGVLLYRNVSRTNTYFQIYGRLCKVGSKKSPLLVDITNSVYNISDFRIFKSSRCRKENLNYSKRDIFEVSSNSFRYVELSDEINPFKVKQYREVTWTSLASLDAAMGKARGSASWFLNHKSGRTAEDYIDYLLKCSDYEQYKIDNHVGTREVTVLGIKYRYSSMKDLVIQIGRDSDSRCVREDELHKYISIIEWEKSIGIVIGGSYRGINITSIPTVASSLKMSYKSLETFIRVENLNIYQCIDLFLDEDKWYRGVTIVNGVDLLTNILDLSRVTIANAYSRLGSMKKLIDCYIPIINGSNNCIDDSIKYKKVSYKLGLKYSELCRYIRINGCSIEDCIDYFSATKEEDDIICKYIDDPDRLDIYARLIPGRTVTWYRARCRVNGLLDTGCRRYTKEELDLIDFMYKDGCTWAEITSELNKLQCNIERSLVRYCQSVQESFRRNYEKHVET